MPVGRQVVARATGPASTTFRSTECFRKISLVTGLSGRSWERAATELDLPFLRTVVIGDKGAEDGYVAWHRPSAVWDDDDALGQLRSALAAVLSTHL
jgi:2,4-dichlorophenol 6-monooxygenase